MSYCDKNDYYPVRVIRSSRRSIGIEIRPDCSVYVRAPYKVTNEEIRRFLQEKDSWIRKHLELMEGKREQLSAIEPLSVDEIRELADRALEVIPPKAAHYAELLKVSYGRITIRNQKTRWGSCSSKGNLNFNCLLMLMPDEVIDYVVVHELCHRIEMNHSKEFWALVESVLPDYKNHKKWLKEHDGEFMRRMKYC
ncbi:MAG: SprT family zinc-dependent metalloprotease [Eubacteriales bacterium]|nr:SprT family zinc-dependent metalloprotease [Eubacteriales bacterium]